MAELTLGSLFAGVGGFDLGMEAAGWSCRWQVEWDKHCQQVLARHWPDVPRWGDVCDVNGADLPTVDCITFGSPCQDLSVARKRAGLEGARSGLFHEAIRIIKEMRDATQSRFPRWAIWENVAGALSSNKGDDFGTVLDTLADAGALVIEWAVLDARWFGVPQRRRRVFVIACFDPATAAGCPDPLLPVAARSGWHPPTGGQKGKDFTNALTCGLGSGGPDAAHADAGWLVPATAGTLSPGAHPGPYNGQDAYNDLLMPVPFVKGKRASTVDDDETWIADAPAPTLNAFDNNAESRATVLAFDPGVIGPLTSSGMTRARGTESVESSHVLAVSEAEAEPDLVPAVRRLTPLECERLMGWPDDHTRWRADGTEQADSSRYRQCGNGVASPVAAWIGRHLFAATVQLEVAA